MKKETANKKRILFVCCSFLLFGLLSHPVYADCVYEGYAYPTGTTLGDLTCQPDGTWK